VVPDFPLLITLIERCETHMIDGGVSDALGVLLASDPDVVERDELAALVRELRKVRGWLDAADVKLARRGRALHEQGRAESPGSLLTDEGRRSGREAKATEDRERVCDAMPGFEDALATGDVSADHLDVINRATKGLSTEERAEFDTMADELLADASSNYVNGFERTCKSLAAKIKEMYRSEVDAAAELERQRSDSKVSRWVDRVTGMHKTLIELDPVRDASLWSAIEAQLATLKQQTTNAKVPYQQLQVEALLAAVSAGQPGQPGLRVPEITIVIDVDTLQQGRHDDTVCETRGGVEVPVATARRLCCDAEVIPVVLGGPSEVLDVGRTRRTATKPQRDALAAIYRTCAHPDCHVAFDACRIHHIDEWVRDRGPTDLANLIPLCELAGHHHQVHEGGWTITITTDRTITWTRPDGTTWKTSTPDRQPHHTTA